MYETTPTRHQSYICSHGLGLQFRAEESSENGFNIFLFFPNARLPNFPIWLYFYNCSNPHGMNMLHLLYSQHPRSLPLSRALLLVALVE